MTQSEALKESSGKMNLIKLYNHSFLVDTIIISIPTIFFIYVSLYNIIVNGKKPIGVFFLVGILCLFWSIYICLRKSSKGSFIFSYLLVNLLWWPLFIHAILRIIFIIQNGGMERADGYGSPVLFLFNFLLEMIIFLPLTYTIVLGFKALKFKIRKSHGKIAGGEIG